GAGRDGRARGRCQGEERPPGPDRRERRERARGDRGPSRRDRGRVERRVDREERAREERRGARPEERPEEREAEGGERGELPAEGGEVGDEERDEEAAEVDEPPGAPALDREVHVERAGEGAVRVPDRERGEAEALSERARRGQPEEREQVGEGPRVN